MTPQVRTLLEECCTGKRDDAHVLTRVVLRSGKGNAQLPIRDARTAWREPCCRVMPDQCWMECKVCHHRQPTGTTCARCKRFHRAWKYAGKRDGRGLLVHDLRRSMAKVARASGLDIKTIMDAGGWKTMSVFHRYSIGDRKDQQRYADAMVKARAQAAQPTDPPTKLVGLGRVGDKNDLATATPINRKPA